MFSFVSLCVFSYSLFYVHRYKTVLVNMCMKALSCEDHLSHMVLFHNYTLFCFMYSLFYAHICKPVNMSAYECYQHLAAFYVHFLFDK